MSTTHDRFERDVLYLQQNQLPTEQGGELVEKLKYKGKDESCLTDQEVEKLSSALIMNDKF
jgi:hypothetical protein